MRYFLSLLFFCNLSFSNQLFFVGHALEPLNSVRLLYPYGNKDLILNLDYMAISGDLKKYPVFEKLKEYKGYISFGLYHYNKKPFLYTSFITRMKTYGDVGLGSKIQARGDLLDAKQTDVVFSIYGYHNKFAFFNDTDLMSLYIAYSTNSDNIFNIRSFREGYDFFVSSKTKPITLGLFYMLDTAKAVGFSLEISTNTITVGYHGK